MELKPIVKLQFTSPLHLGLGLGDHYDTADKMLHSDTISGAIASQFAIQFPNKDVLEFMKRYRVSSAFPYHYDTLFLPSPVKKLQVKNNESESYSSQKKWKNVEFIDLKVFNEVLKNSYQRFTDDYFSKDGRLLFSQASMNSRTVSKSQVAQRVTVPRDFSVAVPFFMDRVYFEDNCGLYFYYQIDKEFESLFKELLKNLGRSGIGTDKSVGNGQFEPEFTKIDLGITQTTDSSLLLSMFCPGKDEINAEILGNSFYQLRKRGGYLAGTSIDSFRHLRKKSVFMFIEGSILNSTDFKGKILDVRPNWNDPKLHPVYRDARAFYLPI